MVARDDFVCLQPVKSCPFKLFAKFFTRGILKFWAPQKFRAWNQRYPLDPPLNGPGTVCQVPESVPHFLLQCPIYSLYRTVMQNYVESIGLKFDFQILLSNKNAFD